MTATTTTRATDDLPRWDVSEYFPSLESKEFALAHEALEANVARLQSLYDRHDVRDRARELDGETVAAFDEVITATNEVLEQLGLLSSYVYAFVSTDTRDATAQSVQAKLQVQGATLATLNTRLAEWVRALGAPELVDASAVASDHAFPILRAAERAEHQMSEAEESLASDLALTGSTAWNRLYQDVSSGMTATVELPDGPEVLPIFSVRALATDPHAAVREAAFRAELTAWAENAVPIAAAMNAIKGETLTLTRRRGWSSPLDAQLFGQAVDRGTLDAMLEAMVASLPDFRRYLHAKARLLGKERCAFWDLFAPVGTAPRIGWDDATVSVERAFAGYSPQLARLARRALDDRWIDVPPRAGKVGGAFCMPTIDGASRVLLNWNESFDGVQTLAHELGHAYHNTQLAERTPLQRRTPSSLAETASIFCETVMVAHGLASAGDGERLVILEVDLQGSCQVIVDIYSRFLFESRVFERRAATTLSVTELCDLMRDAQIEAYGDGLDHDELHPYMWAAKPHYYGSTFYNWPYAYGLLFGIGLFARYEADPDGFRAGYDDLLSATGLADAAGLAARFDIDVRDVSFWTSSLDVVRARIDELDRLAPPPT
jgi:pepF/M3 family oligoendopeptidase